MKLLVDVMKKGREGMLAQSTFFSQLKEVKVVCVWRTNCARVRPLSVEPVEHSWPQGVHVSDDSLSQCTAIVRGNKDGGVCPGSLHYGGQMRPDCDVDDLFHNSLFTLPPSLPPSPVFWFLSVFLELRLLFLLSAHSKSSEVTTGWTNSVNLAALLCCQDDRLWWGNYLGVGIQRATTAETWYVVMELNYRPVCVCVCVHMTWTSWQWYS